MARKITSCTTIWRVVKLLQDFQPRSARHHDIEKDQIRPLAVGDRDGSLAILGLVDGADPTEAAEMFSQRPSSQWLIVGDSELSPSCVLTKMFAGSHTRAQ